MDAGRVPYSSMLRLPFGICCLPPLPRLLLLLGSWWLALHRASFSPPGPLHPPSLRFSGVTRFCVCALSPGAFGDRLLDLSRLWIIAGASNACGGAMLVTYADSSYGSWGRCGLGCAPLVGCFTTDMCSRHQSSRFTTCAAMLDVRRLLL